MMFRNLSKQAHIRKVAKASGTVVVDTQGFDSVLFLVDFNTAENANEITKLEMSHNNSAFVDVAGSAVNVGTTHDSELGWLEVHKPQRRYLRLTTADNSTDLNSIIALLFRASDSEDVDNVAVSGAINGKLLTSPDEGTP